jgi:hypothetical protein
VTQRGVFDSAPNEAPVRPAGPQPVEQQIQKEDFKSVADQSKVIASDIEKRNRAMAQKSPEQLAADKINQGLSGRNDQADFDEMEKFSEEDIKMAEEFLFNGYVETQIEMHNLPKIKHTICSVNAEEMNLIDEIVYEEAKRFQKPNGEVDISQLSIQSLRSSLYIAFSYKGSNGEDFVKDNRVLQLEIIKKGMKKLSELYSEGDIENVDSFKESIKQTIKKRAARVRQFGTPLIDFLSDRKYKFDMKLFNIMNQEKIIPKS